MELDRFANLISAYVISDFPKNPCYVLDGFVWIFPDEFGVISSVIVQRIFDNLCNCRNSYPFAVINGNIRFDPLFVDKFQMNLAR